MKLFITIVMLATLALAEYTVKTREDLIKYRGECVEKLKISESSLEKYKKMIFPDDSETHCYIKCLLEKFELFKDGVFNVENIHMQLVGGVHENHSDEMHSKIEKCSINEGANDCEKAYRGFMCFTKDNMDLVKMSVHTHDHDHSKH